MIALLRARLSAYFRNTGGSVSVELVLVTPMLFWAIGASYVFFDGYRQSTVNLKAAYTISDLVSRETAAVNDDYIDSMYNLLQLLTRAQSEVKLRISVIR
jgi:Flp pilus assembly protein TadG